MRSLAQRLHDGTAVGDRPSWAAFPHPRFTHHQKQKHTTNRNQWRILRCHIGKFKKHCYSRSSCQSLWGEPSPEGIPIPIRKPPSPSAAVHPSVISIYKKFRRGTLHRQGALRSHLVPTQKDAQKGSPDIRLK
jgi:hypothetical protein